jgi:hypothetical protein
MGFSTEETLCACGTGSCSTNRIVEFEVSSRAYADTERVNAVPGSVDRHR